MTSRARRRLAWALAAAALALVALAYLQPALMLSLSQQLWACF
ncbi:MAG: hypothetical protein ABW005_00205 [Burkholderiaceae bacterium]